MNEKIKQIKVEFIRELVMRCAAVDIPYINRSNALRPNSVRYTEYIEHARYVADELERLGYL